MVASLVYRTTDATRWGGGQGSDLTATTIDQNFWKLFGAVDALQRLNIGAGIDYINQPSGGNLFFIHLTNHAVLGPFTIPSSNWNPKGPWAPANVYAVYDTVTNNGSLYLVLVAHTSAGTFSVNADDSLGHNIYSLLLASPANSQPTGGSAGQRLVKNSATHYDMAWVSDLIRMALYIEGHPDPGETVMQYMVVDNMTLPASLTGTVVYQGTPTTVPCSYTINKNGSVIGTIGFSGSSP